MRISFFAVAFLASTTPLPALAQDAGDALSSGWVWGIIAALVGLGLNFFGTLWTAWVAHAAKSEATWDDWSVARLRDLARSVIKEEQSGSSPIPPSATDTTK